MTKYRELQGFQLTGLQFRLSECLLPEKIEKASLLDLVKSFSVLHKAERRIKGKEGKASFKIEGLLEYLLELERRENEGAPFKPDNPW